jgi:hypothetical protein
MTKKSKSELAISSTIFIVLGLMLGYYLFTVDKATITTADTLTIENKISKYRFDQFTKRGTGYSGQCFYFNLDKYSCDFNASSADNNEVKNVLDSINVAKITIEKSDTTNLWKNKEINVLSLELNNKILITENSSIDNRNFMIKYLLPILTLIILVFGFRDLYKLTKK